MGFTPSFYLPRIKRKGLHAVNGGIKAPYYFVNEAVLEGQPLKLAKNDGANLTKVSDNPLLVSCAVGASDGAKVIGLALQNTYDDALTGQMAQLRGYHFPNDTAQRLDGMPIGILMGQGWAVLENFTGLVAAHEQLGVGPSGLLAGATTSGLASGDKVPVWAENSGNGGTAAGTFGGTQTNTGSIRIRFHFAFTDANG